MATSAIGPGFLTQTTVFTQQLGASFGFVIIVSVVIDIAVQLNVWRVIVVSRKRAQDIANALLPGLGGLISTLIVFGGFAFNIGNVAGAGLGLHSLLDLPVVTGALISAAVAIGIFLVKEAGRAMDRFTQIMAFAIIVSTLYIAFSSSPPVGEAVLRTFVPIELDWIAIITLVGGTVGGYITFSGGHRLLDAGVQGPDAVSKASRSAVMGISVASLIRVFLFLAALGVVAQGLVVDETNPTGSVFQLAAGQFGYRLFGVVMFAAGVTSIVGSAYTSVSFVKSFSKRIRDHESMVIILFILISTAVFVVLGNPVRLLVIAGTLNGFILPVTLTVILFAAYKSRIVGAYKHPRWLTVFGALVVAAMLYMSVATLLNVVM